LDFPFGTITGTALSTGNPHFVSWRDDLNLDGLNREINKFGPDIEHSPHFRKGINFELANMIEADLIQMAVWERGVGRTLACGSGAVATVCAGVKTGRLEQDRSIRVNMAGGILFVTVHGDSDRVTLRGEANYVFSGSIDI